MDKHADCDPSLIWNQRGVSVSTLLTSKGRVPQGRRAGCVPGWLGARVPSSFSWATWKQIGIVCPLRSWCNNHRMSPGAWQEKGLSFLGLWLCFIFASTSNFQIFISLQCASVFKNTQAFHLFFYLFALEPFFSSNPP